MDAPGRPIACARTLCGPLHVLSIARPREKRENFFPRSLFYFFWKSILGIGESEQKLGHVMFPREAPQLRSDPVARIGSHRPDLYREGRQQRYRLDLNQDLSKFQRRNERRESKWDFVSRNVRYGIFPATPTKRAK